MTPMPYDHPAALAQLACLLEASAPKPGNVSPGKPFRDMRYEDFLASAIAIGPALRAAATEPLGKTIRESLLATRHLTKANTNLGLVLLLAPLVRAALREGATLRQRLAVVLAESSVGDTIEVYAAIREAKPGGLGSVQDQDVAGTPTVTLRQAMALASDRDAVAREYVTDFGVTFERSAPALVRARADGLDWPDAIVETGLTLLAAEPDTLIRRKAGAQVAETVQRRAQQVLAAGGVRSRAGRAELAEFDAALRDPQNTHNPGTTADLTAAATFVVLLSDGWHSA
jgi:triphosphoribosyl-dephospho-CoA synthase